MKRDIIWFYLFLVSLAATFVLFAAFISASEIKLDEPENLGQIDTIQLKGILARFDDGYIEIYTNDGEMKNGRFVRHRYGRLKITAAEAIETLEEIAETLYAKHHKIPTPPTRSSLDGR